MEPEHLHFGGGSTDTLLHPLVAVWMLIAIALILCLPRKYAVGPLLLAAFTIPLGQVVVFAGLHFTVLRILILAGLVRRATAKSETHFVGGFNGIDRFVTLWALSSLLILSLQWMDMQAFIKATGDFLDTLGGYYVLRFLIRDIDDARRAVKALAAVAVLMAICMTNEQVTHINVFGFLGGVPLIPNFRDGNFRAQGAFGVYIDAGVFGGVLMPLLVWLWSEAKSKRAVFLGIAGAIAMILTSHSSTPLLALAAGIVGLCLWPLRKQMRFLRWGLVLVLVALHLAMKAPVWALIAHVDLTGSSSGYHRYYLVDNFIRHFSDWWLLGYRYYSNWGWDMWDLSNQFVAVGLTGGLLTFLFFVGILSRSFGGLGDARRLLAGDRHRQWMCWCFGSALFANVTAFFGCSYMAQMQMALFPLLAMISVAKVEARKAVAAARVPTLPEPEQPALPEPAGVLVHV